MKLAGFPPIGDARTHTLILGSFPGVASLVATQYYAHPRNQFWRLVGAAIGEPLHEMAYDARIERLLEHGIGLWDVLAACEREGSLDTAIRHASPNDFAAFHTRFPMLRKVCFNGKTSGKFAPVLAAAGYATLILPSSSAANAILSFDQKLRVWRDILTHDESDQARIG
ncbi:G:T/U mismatch-specific uracil/thymine DNA-glycosylase [Candidatus Burkholderia verschuerenii]|uniref:G:T/U mismatch-specific uracil/thymine DNA-glycosylase n=1 Tax=Candidatus Burkholderia verschuerenii TaxID=242163 RepID=A0A0L0MHQ1_9BURK|nr:DNA-deoxyinosine glycosylase [Candidatus Burkholderia verschuerenii]KND61836.1 G:T/U mismatch-specific uracil/thymine DNA-glycosylase [Candidatus Burkholderia verschuerenii]